MSRNATALKPSTQRRPVRRLRSVTLSAGFQPGRPQFSNRVQGLKNLALSLLSEVQSLEGDALISELATPQGLHQIDLANGIKLDDTVRQFESNIIRQALLVTGGNQAQAARLLGIKPNTLNYKIKTFNL